MSVYKPAKSRLWHFDFQWKGRRFHGSTGCGSRRDAERFEAAERRRVALGENVRPTLTVDDACGTWWEEKGRHMRSRATIEYQLAAIVAGLGRRTLLGELTLREFDRYVARRRDGRANASVNREVQLARRVWGWAEKRGYDVAAIAWGELMLSEPTERVRELSAAEEKRLLAALPASLRPIVDFALLSGARKAEVVGLLWSDVDLAGGRATLRVKGGGRHVIPLTPAMVALIAEQPKVAPPIFTYECERNAPPRGDRPRRVKGVRYPFSAQGWDRRWRKALADAGVSDFRFHDLRHTKGTRALRATGNLKSVQRLLGHADITTTARYAHALEDDVREAMLASESRNSPEPTAVESLETRRKPRSTG